MIRSWRSGKTGFRKPTEAKGAEGAEGAEGTESTGKRKRSRVEGGNDGNVIRKRLRGVVTIGLKAKGKIKSPEFILDSDTEEHA